MCGCYIELKNQSKLDYLKQVGEEISGKELLEYNFQKKQDKYPVFYFKNQGIIEVAGILYSEKELKRLILDRGLNDRYFLVNLVDLVSVSNISSFI